MGDCCSGLGATGRQHREPGQLPNFSFSIKAAASEHASCLPYQGKRPALREGSLLALAENLNRYKQSNRDRDTTNRDRRPQRGRG